jgi:transcription termination factor Rho
MDPRRPVACETLTTGRRPLTTNAAGLPTDTTSQEENMTVLHRDALEASPLADLHAIASELGIDGYRRLRKADLVERILEHQDGDGASGDASVAADRDEMAAVAEVAVDVDEDEDEDALAVDVVDEAAEDPDARPRRRRGVRGGRGRSGREEGERDRDRGRSPREDSGRDRGRTARDEVDRDGEGEEAERGRRDEVVEGVVELLANGSGFVRLAPPEPSDGDVYISAAQVRRCELVSGDRVSGPVRRPRRSERYPSLVRVDTINGAPAEEVAEGTPYDELPCAFPSVRLELGADDPTLKAIEWLTPIGRGSRVVITGGPRAGKTETLRRLAGVLSGSEGIEVSLVLTGVRPEEAAEWKVGPVEPSASLTLAASGDAQGQALERVVETAQRIAARGGHALVLVDTLDAIAPATARKAMAAARAIVDGGSLTIIATASRPLGGETTVIGLDATRTAARNFPALDLAESGALRPELLVGEAGADAIAAARAETTD